MNKNFTKSAAVLLFVTGAASTVSAQFQKVGDNPFGLNASAALEIETPSNAGQGRGFLPPRLTANQQGAIVKPSKGLMVYNTDKNGLMVNTGTDAAPVWKAASTFVPASLVTKVADYTLTPDDYTVLGSAATKSITLTLPAASAATGKIYIVGKTDELNTVTFSPALKLTKTVSVTALNYSKTFRIQSDGANWNIID